MAKTIFSKYSNERRRELQIRTDIVQEEDGTRRVRKYALLPEGKENIARIVRMYGELSEAFGDPKVSFCESIWKDGCAESPFLTGVTLQELMETAANEQREDVLTGYIREYMNWIREDGGEVKFVPTPEFEVIFGKIELPETLTCAKVSDIDLIFANIIIEDGKWQIIDYEWSYDFPIPKNFVIYRSLFFAHHRIRQCKALELGHLYEMAGFTEQEVKAYEQMEKHFQAYISGDVFPVRDMYLKTGTKRITLNEVEQIRGEIELRQLTAGSKGKKGNMIKKIQYHIDRIEYQLGKAVCGGWAFAVTKTGAYLPVNIRLENERKEPIDAAFSRNARGDVAQALKITGQKGTDWGFNYTWLTNEETSYRMIFSVDGYEVVHRVTTEDLERSFREYRRRYPDAETAKRRKDDKIAADDWYYLKTEGIRALRGIRKQRFNKKQVPYPVWRTYQVPDEKELNRQRQSHFEKEPLISIIVPAYRTPEKFLREMIESVQAQSYGNWELCIADGSLNDSIRGILEEYATKDPRVRYEILDGNYGISGNTNAALAFAKGDYIGLLDHDDLLEPDALYENVMRINEEDAKLLYSDEDKVSLDLREYFDPHFKPDYNRDYMQCCNYICHFFVVERQIVEEAGHFDSSCDGSQDYDFILRCIAKSPKVTHIPKVLYHWRCHPDSTALNPESKLYCYEAGKRALELDLAAHGQERASVHMGKYYGMYEVYYPLEEKPLISVITSKREKIESLLAATAYDSLEVVEYGEQETTAAIREAAGRAKGGYLIFLPEGTGVDREDWLTVMAANAVREKIGIVGPKLLGENGHVLSAGMAIGLRATAGSLFVGNDRDSVGYFSRTIIQQEIGAVAFAGMMTEKRLYEELGGLNESYGINEAALEFCLKVRKRGKEVLFTPFVSLELADDRFAPQQVNITDEAFRKNYGSMAVEDGYYSSNFDRDGADYTLAFK